MAGPGGEQSALGQALSTLWKRRALVGALIIYTVFTVLMTQRLLARRGAQLTQPVDSSRAATRLADVSQGNVAVGKGNCPDVRVDLLDGSIPCAR